MVEATSSQNEGLTRDEMISCARDMLTKVVEDIAVTDDQRVQQSFLGEQSIEQLKAEKAKPAQMAQLLAQLNGMEPYSNLRFENVTHVPVFHQNKEGLCGFYMLHNSKTFVKSLLSRDKFTQLLHLTRLKYGKEFYRSFLYTTSTLLACRNTRYLNNTDRKDIQNHKGTLEREHISYLLGADQELVDLMQNERQVPVFFARIEFSFGNLALDRDPALHMDQQIEAFLQAQGQAIFVYFFGVVNHWISVIIFKTGVPGEANQIFVLDSSNLKHMNLPDEDMVMLSLESRCWKKIRLGMKPTIKFMVEMSIQSLFDQRNFYRKINQIFNGTAGRERLTIPRLLLDCQVNYMLKEFHMQTEQWNPNAKSELQAPPNTSGLRLHHGEVVSPELRPVISQECKLIYRKGFDEAWYEQKCAQWKMHEYSWGIDQFLFNEKQVTGNYGYIADTDGKDTERLTNLYQAVDMFLKCCQQPRHVEGRTLLNMRTFGVGALTEKTRRLLQNWSLAICALDAKVKQNGFVMLGTSKKSRAFATLVKICELILSQIPKAPQQQAQPQQAQNGTKSQQAAQGNCSAF